MCNIFWTLQKKMLDELKCGADFLPSPLASRPEFAFKADPVWETQGFLTAVAVDVENDHTVAFLGNNQGEVFKVGVHLFKRFFTYLKNINILPSKNLTSFFLLSRYTWAKRLNTTAQFLVMAWGRMSTETCFLTSVTTISTLPPNGRWALHVSLDLHFSHFCLLYSELWIRTFILIWCLTRLKETWLNMRSWVSSIIHFWLNSCAFGRCIMMYL